MTGLRLNARTRLFMTLHEIVCDKIPRLDKAFRRILIKFAVQ